MRRGECAQSVRTERAHWAKSTDAVKDAVVANVRTFIGKQTVYDDLTLLVVKQL